MFSRETKNRQLKPEDAGLQRTDLILCEASRRDNTVCVMKATYQLVCILYKSLVTTYLLETIEVQIQFTWWPERDRLVYEERQKERETCGCTQNKNKHPSSFRLCLSVQRVKNNLKANPL